MMADDELENNPERKVLTIDEYFTELIDKYDSIKTSVRECIYDLYQKGEGDDGGLAIYVKEVIKGLEKEGN